MKYTFCSFIEKIEGNKLNPLEVYLKIRNEFPNALLLESSSGQIAESFSSIICMNPVYEICIEKSQVKICYPNSSSKEFFLEAGSNEVYKLFSDAIKSLHDKDSSTNCAGFYGYFSYEMLKYFEKIKLNALINQEQYVPEMRMSFYSNLITFDPVSSRTQIIEYQFEGKKASSIERIRNLVQGKTPSLYAFSTSGKTSSNLSDKQHKEMVLKGKKACFKGDVFQIVLSRGFKQKFQGDDFALYQSLRSINPSAHLFYFDYGNYKIFGCSPESQLIVKNKKAYIEPIAGTIRRSTDKKENERLVKKLKNDPKENAEHVMLVDLARNDLSKNCSEVKLEKYKEIKYFSHVLHMASKISGKIQEGRLPIKVFGDTFPAGPLSGAPKYKAIELIDELENQHRGIYAGSIGFFSLTGDIHTAILIRSFLSKDNQLFFQAGGGIVALSDEENELQEVHSKLMALNKAIELAKK